MFFHLYHQRFYMTVDFIRNQQNDILKVNTQGLLATGRLTAYAFALLKTNIGLAFFFFSDNSHASQKSEEIILTANK
ncbi:CLUMA_CG020819, isoform A [Clunio marinus]|uniref:CLUMA_CG020819, isoform A n=1 Tax=Clunio marinus TaxID=568069 RepID=A0A1J1JA12_9DIPT|nr:CLUMA_CG020819, isoform A [Clunio marinus]